MLPESWLALSRALGQRNRVDVAHVLRRVGVLETLRVRRVVQPARTLERWRNRVWHRVPDAIRPREPEKAAFGRLPLLARGARLVLHKRAVRFLHVAEVDDVLIWIGLGHC